MAHGITAAEFRTRRLRLIDHVRDQGLSGVVLFDSAYILYFAGFNFLSTERPVVFAMDSAGDTALLVPAFEVAHARLKTDFERIESYVEYPGEKHPMIFLAEMLSGMGIRKQIAADADGYPGILGYQGPPLSEVTAARIVPASRFIEDMIAIKSQAEVDLIRESCTWCNLGHRLLQRYSLPGVSEAEASLQAESKATLAMLDALGSTYHGQQGSSDGVKAGYRGQIGMYSALAHAVAGNHVFKPGDVLVSETGAPVWGYNSELERTMIIGDATDEQRRLFDHMVEAQVVAFGAIRPGRTCSEVDRDVLAYFEERDLTRYWGQHTGHAIGLRNHEAPFLDLGDHTVIKPGMVFTVEPGLYAEGLAGFRHSDTVVVTEDGIDIVTYYPRDLESLTIRG
jgi:Xaa-Pro dipeptidase